MGFIAGSGSRPQASACATCARPISPPPAHGNEWFDMFCALNGATATPFRRNQAQIAVTIQLLPALDDVPPTKIERARGPLLLTTPSFRVGFRVESARPHPNCPFSSGGAT